MRVTGEFLPDALMHLRMVGGFLRAVTMEAVNYRVEFQHPNYDGCETEILYTCDKERGEFMARLRTLGPTAENLTRGRTEKELGAQER
jgi:hypothetical protein